MAADQGFVFGKSHVAFNNACAHAGCSFIRLFRVLGKHQGSAAVANGKISFYKRAIRTALQLVLQHPGRHVRC